MVAIFAHVSADLTLVIIEQIELTLIQYYYTVAVKNMIHTVSHIIHEISKTPTTD